MTARLLRSEDIEKDRVNNDLVVRYSRLSMLLTFLAAQDSDDFSIIRSNNLVTPDEEQWLQSASIGSRPMLVVGWLSEFFDTVTSQGYTIGDMNRSFLLTNLINLRSSFLISYI